MTVWCVAMHYYEYYMILNSLKETKRKEISMGNFIEELFYGNIDPQERSIKKNRKVRREMKILSENEDYLLKELAGEPQKRFLEYVDAWGIVNGESTLDSFITGFRLGARFAYDTFVSEEAPFEDLLKEK